MSEYPKTENLWKRDPETHVMAASNGYRHHAFDQVNSWLVLEKIDGMNMRVIWYPDADKTPIIAGRSDRAQIPGDLMTSIQTWATYEKMMAAFSTYREVLGTDGPIAGHFRPETVVLYGEGYGPGIQQGGHYRDDKSFILFDVLVDGHWLKWADVCDVAAKLGIETVPVLGEGMTTQDVEESLQILVERGTGEDCKESGFLTETPEGVIARTDPYLFDARGNRVMFKHKVRDVVA